MICLLFVATSCLDEHRFGVISSSKDEVKFSAELKRDAQTRTLYGADNQATNIKVKWVDGDKVMVFGTTCVPPASENQVGEYTIQISGENTPNNDNSGSKNMSVADNLVKIEEVGVRWGSAETSDFVAVYPSDNAAFQFNSSTGVVTASTSISATQNYVFSDEMVQKTLANGTKINVWEGTHFANDATNPSMQNAIMYARTDDVKNGNPVSLSFEPFSTVLKFRFEGFESLWSTDAEAYIQSITLKAPTGVNIAGDFDITIPRNADQSAENPVRATATGNNSNTITINTIKQGGSYLKIAANQAVEFNVFTLPLNGVTITGDETTSVDNLWTVTIKVQGVGDLTYKLLPVDGADDKAKTYTLVPGLIHKVKVPKMISNKVPEWNPENWITQIPPPVYISELSVPGAWYCFDSGYQNTTDLTALYNAGIRAFNIDCRLAKKDLKDITIPIIGLKVDEAWRDDKYNSSSRGTYGYLACAGSEPTPSIGFSDYQILPGEGTYVLDAMKKIVTLAQSNLKEYVVVVFTIAEKPLTNSGAVFGSVNPIYVMDELNAVLNTVGIKEYLYTGISKDTTIDDITKVQADGKVKNVIVKINHCTDDFYKNSSYNGILPAGIMGSFGSMASNATYNLKNDIITNIAGLYEETVYADYFTKMLTDDIYNGTTKTDMVYCYHQAQNTSSSQVRDQVGTGIPTLGMRMDAIDDIVEQSKSVYDNAEHNHWFQLGIGGSLNGDNPSGVSNVLNPYVNTVIQNKMDTDPSPVGIVLMNHCTTTGTIVDANGNQKTAIIGIDLVDSIIEMNGKFYLNRRGNDIVTGDGEQNGANQSAVTKSCGNATIGFNAF